MPALRWMGYNAGGVSWIVTCTPAIDRASGPTYLPGGCMILQLSPPRWYTVVTAQD